MASKQALNISRNRENYHKASSGCKRPLRFLVLLVFVLSYLQPLSSPGQESHDFSFYDDSTYQLYQLQDWRGLIRLGKEALREGYDYYYLRMRLGIAYTEQKKYQLAVPQFRRATRLNPESTTAEEYLYSSLLGSGRVDEAFLMAPGKGSFFRTAYTEAGYKKSDLRTPVADLYYGSVGLRHNIGRHLSLSHIYQYLEQEYLFSETILVPPPHGNGPWQEQEVEKELHFRQHEYFLGGALSFRRGWRPGFGFRQIMARDSLRDFDRQVAALSLTKNLPRFTLGLSGSWANFSGSGQWQYNAALLYYPLANTRLYYQLRFSLQSDSSIWQHWLAQQVGIKIADNLWLEGQFDFGDISNLVEYDGAIAYNVNDELKRRYGLGLQYWASGRHLLLLKYLKEEKAYYFDGGHFNHDAFIMAFQLNLN